MLLTNVDREHQSAEFRWQSALPAPGRSCEVHDHSWVDSGIYANETALSHLRTALQLALSLAVTAVVLGAIFVSLAIIAGI